MKKIWIDLETTGLNSKTDTIIELAAVCGKSVFHEYSLPDEKPKNWDEIEKLTGITWDFLANHGVNEEVLYTRFEAWLCSHIDKYNKKDKAVFSGYGSKFDSDFIRELFSKHYNNFYGSFFVSMLLDVQSFVAEALANDTLPMIENYKLVTVCTHFGITFVPHSAIEDIRATQELYELFVQSRT